jgi:hypothetical protein
MLSGSSRLMIRLVKADEAGRKIITADLQKEG